MTSEPVVGVVFGCLVEGKMTLAYTFVYLFIHLLRPLSSPELRPTTDSDVITP